MRAVLIALAAAFELPFAVQAQPPADRGGSTELSGLTVLVPRSTKLSGLTVLSGLKDVRPCQKTVDGPWPSALFDPGAQASRSRPSPGTREYFGRYVAAQESGKPNYDEMTKDLARTVRNQFEVLQQRFRCLGEVKSIDFLHVSDAGYDDYRLTFKNGVLEWAIAPLDDHQKSHSQYARFFQPRPATNELIDLIRSLQADSPQYDGLSPDLAAELKDRWPTLRDKFKGWGQLESVYFVRQADNGAYLFLVSLYRRGRFSASVLRTAWAVGVDPETGKLTSMAYTIFN
jgi:hypothetical protein